MVICINTEIFNKSFEGEVIRRYLSVFSRFQLAEIYGNRLEMKGFE